MRILVYLLACLLTLTACHKKSAGGGVSSVSTSTHDADGGSLPADSLVTTIIQAPVQNGVLSPYYTQSLYLDLFNKGVDYYAKDLSLGCILEMDFEKEFRFTEPDGTHYIFLPVKGVQSPGSNLTTYTIVSGTIRMIITIEKVDCRESQTGVIYPFRTFVHIENGAAYNGYPVCGFYVVNPALDNVWVLESVNGTAVDSTKYPGGVPALEMHMDSLRVQNFGGCNQVRGTFYMEKKQVCFRALNTTVMDCKSSDLESDFISILSERSFLYVLEEKQLVLTHPDRTTLVFKKYVN